MIPGTFVWFYFVGLGLAFCLAGFWARYRGAKELLLALHSETIPGRLKGQYGMWGIEYKSAMHKAKALLTATIPAQAPSTLR